MISIRPPFFNYLDYGTFLPKSGEEEKKWNLKSGEKKKIKSGEQGEKKRQKSYFLLLRGGIITPEGKKNKTCTNHFFLGGEGENVGRRKKNK